MELIDRYVAEVGRNLPPKQRADIQAELHSLLVDNLEARTQGQPTQEDLASLLKEFGPPQKMAASYWPEGQYLIGPTLYPRFRMVVGIALLVTVIVQVVLLAVALIFQPEGLPVSGFIDDFVPTIISVFGWIVIAFAIMQRMDVRLRAGEEPWDPLSLPPAQDIEPVSQVGIVTEIALGLVLSMLLVMLPDQLPQLFPPSVQLYISPVLVYYLPLLVLTIILGVCLNVVLLWRGKWETGTRLTKITLNLFGVGVLALLISGHTAWLMEHGSAGFFPAIENVAQTDQISDANAQILAMEIYRMVFIIAMLATLADTLRIGWGLVKTLLNRPGTPTYPSSGAASAG